MKLAPVLILLGISAVSAQPQQRPEIPPRLTLEQAVAIALQHSPALRRAESAVAGAEAAHDQARAARLPHLSVGAFEALQTINLQARGIQAPEIPGIGSPLPIRVGPFSQVDARGFLTQEVINLPLRYRHRAGGARLEAQEASSRDAREWLTLQVASTYIQAQRNQAAEATLRQQLALARQLHTIAVDRFQQGVASSLDVKRSLQQVNHIQQSLLEAQNALTGSKLQLAHIIHAQIRSEYELADIARFYDTRVMSESEALETALRLRADFLAAEAQVRAAELDLRAAKAKRYPVLSFEADYGQSGRQPFRNLNTYRIQGSLKVPVFLGGSVSAEARERQSRLEEARAFREEVQSQIETEVLTALAGVASAKRQVEVAEETIQLAQDEVDLSTARFTTGVTDTGEVVDAQERLTRAEENRIRALFHLNLNRAHLHRATGTAEKAFRP